MAGPTNANTGRSSSPTRPAPARRAAPAAAPRGAAQTAPAGVPVPAVVAPAAVPAGTAPVAVPSPAPHTAPAHPAPAPAPSDSRALLYGLVVVVAGFAAILIALFLVLINNKVGDSATAILGLITTSITGLGGAAIGFAVGQQGTSSANNERAAAEAARDEAQMRTIKFAAYLDPAVGRRLVE